MVVLIGGWVVGLGRPWGGVKAGAITCPTLQWGSILAAVNTQP
jgi:hypothetical protein